MHRQNALNGFQFDHHQVLDEEVDAIARVENQIVISNREQNLSTRTNFPLFQFVPETGLVSTFEQPGANDRVDAHRRSDNRVADFVFDHFRVLSDPSASSAVTFQSANIANSGRFVVQPSACS